MARGDAGSAWHGIRSGVLDLRRERAVNVRTDGILAELPPILPFDEWIKLSEEEHGRRRAQTIGVLRRCIAVIENDMIGLDGSRSRLT